jgi:hypothetical protein
MYTYVLMHLQRMRWRSSRAYQGREISHPPDDHKALFAIPSQSFSFVSEISTNLNSSLHDRFLELLSSMLVLITFMRYLFWQLTKIAYVQCGVVKSFIVCHSPKMLDPPNQSLDHLPHSFALHSYCTKKNRKYRSGFKSKHKSSMTHPLLYYSQRIILFELPSHLIGWLCLGFNVGFFVLLFQMIDCKSLLQM